MAQRRKWRVVITGASAGVGRATAHRFAQAGASIGLIARDERALNDVKAEVEELGGIGFVASADVADPAAVFALFRRCVLGLDQNCGGTGNLRGLHRWNADATLAKDLKFTERVGATFTLQFTNVFNHRQPSDPPNSSSSFLSLSSPTNFGKITGSTYASRQMEFGLRIHF